MKQDWLDSVKERMDGYEESIPEGLWAGIEASVFPKKKTVVLPWIWRSVAVAAVLALGVFAGVRLMDDKFDKYDSQESRTSSTNNPSSSADMEGVTASSAEPVALVPADHGRLVAKADIPADAMPEAAQAVPAEGRQEDVSDPQRPSDQEKSSFKTTHDGEDWSGYASATDDGFSRRRSGPTAGLSITGTASGSQDVRTMESQMFYRGPTPMSSDFHGDEGATWSGRSLWTRSDELVPTVNSSPVTTDSHHRRPIRASLTVNFPVNDVIGIETGVTYSMLYSTFTTTSGSTVSEDAQTLRYVGIPVKLNASVIDGDKFSLYLTGGGMAEKCVSGKVANSLTVSGEKQGKTVTRSLDVKDLMWSLNAAAGAQLKVTDRLGIYAAQLSFWHQIGNPVNLHRASLGLHPHLRR